MLLKKNAKFNWTDECQNAFEKLKESLITKPILHLYDSDLTCHVFIDASQKSVGALLKQPDASNVLHPIAYHSRTLRDYEKNYAITELECLAIIDALDKFYCYLHDQKFIIHSDHTALVWLKNVKNLRGRLFCWSLKLSMYDYEIKYLKGSTNIEAYMLYRHPVAHHLQHSSHLLDINEIKTDQKNDNLCGPKYHEIKDIEAHEIHRGIGLRCIPVVSCSSEHHAGDNTIWLGSTPILKENIWSSSDASQLSSPSFNLTRELVARWLFRVTPFHKGTIHLQTYMLSRGFEPRPTTQQSMSLTAISDEQQIICTQNFP
ncbi:retrovirus-related Pol polyprotein from transposon 297 [Trichonephila clavipes]|nr:retrovirus-related Pol polyprotein from transposon 297 [Trichonephila clavipes]